MKLGEAIAIALNIFLTVGPAGRRFIDAINKEVTESDAEEALDAQDESILRLKDALALRAKNASAEAVESDDPTEGGG